MKKIRILAAGLGLLLALGTGAAALADEPTVVAPEGYVLGAPLPLYAAVRGDYQTRLDPQWFTDAAITSDETHYNGLVDVRSTTFADGGYFHASQDGYSFNRWMDTTTWRPDLRGEIGSLTWFAQHGGGTYVEIEPLTLEKEALHGVTLEGAQATFEGMLQQTVGGAWAMEDALDLDEARIHQVGAAYNAEQRAWDDLLNQGRYYPDFDSLTEADECYHLQYRYLVDGLPAYHEYNWFGADALISADGIEQIDTRVKYLQGELLSTPERLLTPEEIMDILPREMRKYRFGGTLHSVIGLELIYSVQENASSPTGRVMAPAWYILYLDDSAAEKGYTCEAVFSAVDGAMLQSMFAERGGG